MRKQVVLFQVAMKWGSYASQSLVNVMARESEEGPIVQQLIELFLDGELKGELSWYMPFQEGTPNWRRLEKALAETKEQYPEDLYLQKFRFIYWDPGDYPYMVWRRRPRDIVEVNWAMVVAWHFFNKSQLPPVSSM